jgi:uncharacterized protein (TIGR00730 family)
MTGPDLIFRRGRKTVMETDDPIAELTLQPWTPDEELLNPAGAGRCAMAADDPARLDAIRAELEGGFGALCEITRGVSIFGSARTPETDPDYDRARQLAAALGREGFTIITGGGPGIMEAANRGAQDAGATSVGLNIELPFEQKANPYLDIELRFEHFFARKVMFVRYASAFVVFPGGFGTLDELFEAITLIQTAKIRHFPVILVGSAFWEGLYSWASEQLCAAGKINADELGLLAITDNLDGVVATITAAYDRQRRETEQRRGEPTAP